MHPKSTGCWGFAPDHTPSATFIEQNSKQVSLSIRFLCRTLRCVNLFLSRRRNEPHFLSYEFPILDFAQKPNLIAHLRLPVERCNRKTGLTMFSFEADCLKLHSIHTSDMSCERVRFHLHKLSP